MPRGLYSCSLSSWRQRKCVPRRSGDELLIECRSDTIRKLTFHVTALLACLLFTAMARPAIGAETPDLSRPAPDQGPTQVRTSFYLADLHEVSGADQTFYADVVVE